MEMLHLPAVTLLSATSVGIDEALESMRASMRGIRFAAVKLLSPQVPRVLPDGVEHVVIPPMGPLGYSSFMLTQLYGHFDTSHCLIVQADGFVIDASRWRDEFLDWDYIGAPWPVAVRLSPSNRLLTLDKNRVGNGGFSLRSRRLVEFVAQQDFAALRLPLKSEDLVICHYLYEEIRAHGLRFAPPELAAKFSVENLGRLYGQSLDTVFGFHGKHLLAEARAKLPQTYFANFRSLHGRLGDELLRGLGRNDRCPCGSGKKVKHCHGVRP